MKGWASDWNICNATHRYPIDPNKKLIYRFLNVFLQSIPK
jgi:hypothetical protein